MGGKAFRLRSLWLGVLRLSLWWDWAHQHKPKGYFARPTARYGAERHNTQSGFCTNDNTLGHFPTRHSLARP